MITWAEVRVGDVIQVGAAGMRWTVTARNDRGAIALRSENGESRGGQPDPAGKVQVIERAPDPEPAAVAALEAAGLKPGPLCGFWDGIVESYCGSDQDVRPYTVGHRCGVHAPGKVRAGLARKRCKCGGSLPIDAKRPENCLRCGKPAPAR